jgi:hypothetical protein
MSDGYKADPFHIHLWIPLQLLNTKADAAIRQFQYGTVDPEVKQGVMMLLVCSCGVYKWIPARELKEVNQK